jgi:hypothetical protein
MATSFPPRRENSEGSPHRWRGAGRDHLCRPQRREHAKGDPRSRQRRSGGSAAPVRRRRLHERPSHGQGASRVEGVGCSRFSDEICPCRAPSLTSTSPPSASRRITSCRKSVLPASRSSSARGWRSYHLQRSEDGRGCAQADLPSLRRAAVKLRALGGWRRELSTKVSRHEPDMRGHRPSQQGTPARPEGVLNQHLQPVFSFLRQALQCLRASH